MIISMIFYIIRGSCVKLAHRLAYMFIHGSVYSRPWFLVVCSGLLWLLILAIGIFTSLIAALSSCLLGTSLVVMVVL
jgi:hypothetical protein